MSRTRSLSSALMGIVSLIALLGARAPLYAEEPGLQLTPIDGLEISQDESFAFRLTITGDIRGQLGEPRWEEEGWRVEHHSQRRTVTSINFSTQVRSEHTIYLQPLRTGTLTVGPFTVYGSFGKLQSNALTVQVNAGNSRRPKRGGVAFLSWERVEGEGPVWFGQRIPVRLSVYIQQGYSPVGFRLGELSLDGFLSEQLEVESAPRRVRIGQNIYQRQRVLAYHLSPLQEGEVTLAPVEVEIGLRRGFRQQTFTLASDPLVFEVRPLPAAPAGVTPPVPVGELSLRLMTDRRQLNVDEVVQLTAFSELDGLIEGCPPLELPSLPGWRVFPSTTREQQIERRGRRYGQRTQRWLLKPLHPGQRTIPALSIPYFNPKQGRYARASSDPITLTVRGSAGAEQVEEPALGGASGERAGGAASAEAERVSEGLQGRSEAPARALAPGALPVQQLRLELGEAVGPSTPLLRRLFWALTPPLIYLLMLLPVGLRSLRARRGPPSPQQRQRAARRALQQLQRTPPAELSAGYSEIARQLTAHLEAWTGDALPEADPEQLSEALASRGVPPRLRRQLQEELENANFARFAPYEQPKQALTDAVARALTILESLETYREETR